MNTPLYWTISLSPVGVQIREVLLYFEKMWIGQKRTRGEYRRKFFLLQLEIFHIHLGSRRTKPQFPVQMWNVFERVVRDLPRSDNSVEGWPRAFNNRVSIEHPTVTKLARCILREQTKFEMDTERIRAGQQPKSKKKMYAALDSRLKRLVSSYSFDSVNDYLACVAVNVKLNS